MKALEADPRRRSLHATSLARLADPQLQQDTLGPNWPSAPACRKSPLDQPQPRSDAQPAFVQRSDEVSQNGAGELLPADDPFFQSYYGATAGSSSSSSSMLLQPAAQHRRWTETSASLVRHSVRLSRVPHEQQPL